MKNKVLLISCFLFFQQINAQYTQVPDPNFEQALIHLGIDSDGIINGQFLTTDAENIAFLYVDNSNISDLTGIEAFINLEWLDASENNIFQMDLSLITSPVFYALNLGDNNLSIIDLSPIPNIVNIGLYDNNFTSIDVSNLTQAFHLSLSDNPLVEITLNNTHIQILRLENTPITSIDLSTVISLQKLFLPGSQIQTLDFTNNFYLEEVIAYNTPLTSINLPNNPYLEKLYIWETQLTNLDLTNCNGLIELKASNIGLTELNLTGNPNLEKLSASFNQLTTLDISQNINLKDLYIKNNFVSGNIDLTNNVNLENVNYLGNLLTEIDFSNNPALEIVDVSNNNLLEFVNIQNGTNESTLILFDGHNCPQLSCVVVDDPLADNDIIIVGANTTLVDSVENCNLSLNETELQQIINIYPNPAKERVYIENTENIEIEKITIYDILGKIVLTEKNSFNTLNLSELNSGILFIKIETENGIITKKIIKE